jgi:hypothetical protein
MGVKGVVTYWEAYIWERVFWHVKECVVKSAERFAQKLSF